MRDFRGGEVGQVAPLVAVLLLGFLTLLGLVSDGGQLLAARRNLQHLADAAARSGAAAIDQDVFRQSATVVIDERAAESAARRYLDDVGFSGEGQVSAGPESVVVALREQRTTLLGQVLELGSVTIRALGEAAPRERGI